jgi:hypothetical protein
MDVLQFGRGGADHRGDRRAAGALTRTVETHVASLVAKAKVTGRSGLTRLANSGTAAD